MVGGGLFTIFGASKPQPVAPDPFGDLDDIDKVPVDPRTASQLEALVEKTRDEVLAYHFAGRPANTMKNYAPKQREWSAWCAKYAWPEGGKYLPGELVDEGKLLLFIREDTAAQWTKKLFTLVGIRGSKVGHAGRVKGAQIAEARG